MRPLLIIALTGCSNGTFAVIKLAAVNGGAGVKSIDLDFTLGKGEATQKLSDGGEIAFPTSATFRLHSTGFLSVVAIARDGNGDELARTSGSGVISTGKTTPIQLVLDFAVASPDLSSADFSADLSSPDLTGVIFPPRPRWPQDFSSVTSVRPTLMWELPAGTDGARVQLCRDRQCGLVLQTLDAAGSSVTLPNDLPAVHTQVYWRMVGLANNFAGTVYSPTWTFRTPFAGTAVDTSFGITFDANGDGFDDLAVGAPLTSSGGQVYVYYGSIGGLVSPSPQIIVEPGGSAGDGFGIALSAAGDVDGDGYGDLIVGAPSSGASDPAPPPGHAYVFFGSPSGISTSRAPVRLDIIPTDVKNQFNAGPVFGTVSTAGDVDGDGYADVIVGAPADILPGFPGTGKAFVFRGGPSGPEATPASIGDGFSDVLVSAQAGGSASNNGSFGYLYLGAGGGLGAKPSPALVFEGATNDRLNAVAGAGDFNADGYADFAMGAAGNNRVYLFRGGVSPSPSPFRVLPPPGCAPTCPPVNAGDLFGARVALARDLLVIGSPCAVYNLATSSCGPGAASAWNDLTTSTPKAQVLMRSGNNGDSFGGAMVMGDYNGDSAYDVTVAAPNAGLVYPYLAVNPINQLGNAIPLGDGVSGDYFGYGL